MIMSRVKTEIRHKHGDPSRPLSRVRNLTSRNSTQNLRPSVTPFSRISVEADLRSRHHLSSCRHLSPPRRRMSKNKKRRSHPTCICFRPSTDYERRLECEEMESRLPVIT